LSLVLSAVALSAAACSESDSDSSDGSPPSPTSASSSAPPIVEPVTPPGTELKLGDRAVIDYDNGIERGLLAITVTSIEPANQAEFAAAYGEQAQGLTPYCTRYTVENLSGADFGTKNGPQIEALVEDDETTGTFLTGGIPSCQPRMSPGDFDHPGARYETADLDATGADETVIAARYDEHDYGDAPLVWRP